MIEKLESKLKVSFSYFIIWLVITIIFAVYVVMLLVGGVIIDIPYIGWFIRFVLQISPIAFVGASYLWYKVAFVSCNDNYTVSGTEDGILVEVITKNGDCSETYYISNIKSYSTKLGKLTIRGLIRYSEVLEGVLITSSKKKKVRFSLDLPIIHEMVVLLKASKTEKVEGSDDEEIEEEW